MTLTKWLNIKFKNLDLELLAVKLDIDITEFLGIINGTICPDIMFVIKIIYTFNLNNDEQLEFFYLIGENLGISSDQVFSLVTEQLVALTQSKSNLKR